MLGLQPLATGGSLGRPEPVATSQEQQQQQPQQQQPQPQQQQQQQQLQWANGELRQSSGDEWRNKSPATYDERQFNHCLNSSTLPANRLRLESDQSSLSNSAAPFLLEQRGAANEHKQENKVIDEPNDEANQCSLPLFVTKEEDSHQKEKNKTSDNSKKNKKKTQLVKQEFVFERGLDEWVKTNPNNQDDRQKGSYKKSAAYASAKKRKKREAGQSPWAPCCASNSCCLRCKMFQCFAGSTRRCLLTSLLLLVIYVVAIYSLPFVRIEPSIPPALPVIPFDFFAGPLRPSSASAFRTEHLFRNQIHGPESLAFDTLGNAYLAVEGGFILYAHLNRSSPMRRAYIEWASGGQQLSARASGSQLPVATSEFQQATQASPELFKIAELNGPLSTRQSPSLSTSNNNGARRGQRSDSLRSDELKAGRECKLDEQVYGPNLYTTNMNTPINNQCDQSADSTSCQLANSRRYYFKSNVRVSRCSKPLGIRLSPDESFLYVIDTLNGLYRVNLKQADKLQPSQRQVTRLIDFKSNAGHQLLPVVQLGLAQPEDWTTVRHMNVSLKALDDLAIDHKAGANQGDLIYMTVASQVWPATSYIYDALEGRPSGLVLRFDTGNRLLVVLEPARVAHVRSSGLTQTAAPNSNWSSVTPTGGNLLPVANNDDYNHQLSVTLGAPRLDENDQFDDRPLNFPNGLELMDDRQALLIADTSNKRIIKHYVRGSRAGTSDLWAWTPHLPDNIRRGYDKRHETYWVVGCGKGPAASEHEAGRQLNEVNQRLAMDAFAILRNWPRLRKFLLKNIYFFGATIEFVGAKLLQSVSIQDAGYELRTGSSLCLSGCSGMMILQYNQHGDIIRSIHSREFPNDLMYYSQVNELIDGQNAEHALYLGSPSYSYVTKLVLPTETRAAPPVEIAS